MDTPLIIVAFDEMEKKEIIATMKELGRKVWGYKLGRAFLFKEAFNRNGGMGVIQEIEQEVGLANLFIDLQSVATPRSMLEEIAVFKNPNVRFISCSATSGSESIKTAVGTGQLPHILVGSLLSSLSIFDIKYLFDTVYPGVKSHEFAKMALACGAYGIYCSAGELEFLSHCPDIRDVKKIVAGIRQKKDKDYGDHKFVITPKRAKELGATFVVIGRPITMAKNKIAIVEKIQAEMR